jgi:hypothetical protein
LLDARVRGRDKSLRELTARSGSRCAKAVNFGDACAGQIVIAPGSEPKKSSALLVKSRNMCYKLGARSVKAAPAGSSAERGKMRL